jgi:hypothetical protein
VKAANLELDKDHGMDDPAMATLVAEMQALAPGAPPPEDRRDWAGGLPIEVLAKIAATHVAQTEATKTAFLKGVLGWPQKEIQEEMTKPERNGNRLFVFAMVCKPWRKAQLRVGGRLRTRVDSDVATPGRVALAKWALAEGCPRDDGDGWTMAHIAAQYGHMVLVRWLIQERGFAMDKWVMAMAARSGNVELVRWLRGEGCDWNAWTCRNAAGAGRLGVLQWVRANGCPWNAETCKFAAFNGHLATLRWARENGCDWDELACVAAAQRGHLEVLQWLRAEGCPWDADTCHLAAQDRHPETLRWARENGCDWDADTCAYAAAGGQLEVLQWLRAEGCPWDRHTCRHAAEQDHVEVLRWARENGCEWHAADRDRAAAELGYTDDLGNLVG